MKTPKKPTDKDIINKPLSSREDDEDDDDDMLDNDEVLEDDDVEVDVEEFDVPIDDLGSFDNFDDDDDDDDDRY